MECSTLSRTLRAWALQSELFWISVIFNLIFLVPRWSVQCLVGAFCIRFQGGHAHGNNHRVPPLRCAPLYPLLHGHEHLRERPEPQERRRLESSHFFPPLPFFLPRWPQAWWCQNPSTLREGFEREAFGSFREAGGVEGGQILVCALT